MTFDWYLAQGVQGLNAERMAAALRAISADDCRYPCGKYMSSRQMARVGLGRDFACTHDGPCDEPEDATA